MSNLRTNEIAMLDNVGKTNFTFNSVQDMKNSTEVGGGQFVRTLGYYEPGDGGGNDYEIVAAGAGTADGGSFINLSGSGTQAKGLFGGTVNVRQFGAIGDGNHDNVGEFNKASAYALQRAQDAYSDASKAFVKLPPGLWNLSTSTAYDVVWLIEAGAELKGVPNDSDNMDQTLRLSGSKIHVTARGSNLLHVGGTNAWVDQYREAASSIATLDVISPDGRAAIYAHTRYSDKDRDAGAGCIGVGATAWADQTEGSNDTKSVWSIYAEAGKFHDVPGNAFAMESNVTNYTGKIQRIDPTVVPQGSDRYSVNLWTGGPVPDSGEGTPPSTSIRPSTAAMVVSPGGYYQDGGFDKGIVFLDASFLNGSKEVINCSVDHKYVAYSKSGQDLTFFETTEPSSGKGIFNLYAKDDGTYTRFQFASNQVSPDDLTTNLGLPDRRWSRNYSEEMRPGDGSVKWTSGVGSPEGNVSANVGSMYTRTDGGSGSTLYVKESGSGASGWVAK